MNIENFSENNKSNKINKIILKYKTKPEDFKQYLKNDA